MQCRASTRAMAYSRPARSLVDTPRIQRCARSSGRSAMRGVNGKDFTRRDEPAAVAAAGSGPSGVRASVAWVSTSEIRSR